MAAKDAKDKGKKPEDDKAAGKSSGKSLGPDGDAPEGAEGDAAAAAPQGGLGKKKILMIVGGIIVLLIAVGAGLYFTGMLDSLLGAKVECAEDDEECKAKAAEEAATGGEHGEAASGEHGAAAASGGHGEGANGAFLAIPTMIVNLNSEDGTPRYLRLTVQLELKDQADADAVQAVIPRVIDQFQTYLRELRVKDLRGSAGIYRLQMELLWRVNQAAAPTEVKDVLFQEILLQ